MLYLCTDHWLHFMLIYVDHTSFLYASRHYNLAYPTGMLNMWITLIQGIFPLFLFVFKDVWQQEVSFWQIPCQTFGLLTLFLKKPLRDWGDQGGGRDTESNRWVMCPQITLQLPSAQQTNLYNQVTNHAKPRFLKWQSARRLLTE